MKISILASGSGGNALYVEEEGARLLVDAGVPLRELCRRLAQVPGAPSPERLDGLLCTHEHSDHAAHAAALAERGVPTYATLGTLEALGIEKDRARPITAGRPFRIGAFEVTAVPVPHDAADPVGFVIRSELGRVGVLTDCGHAAPAVARGFTGCDVLVIEANHDPDMLAYGAYPLSLKRRIGGRRGHLSNEEAADLLRQMGRAVPRLVVLAHLSQMNNRPALARGAIARVLGRRPVRVLLAAQSRVLAPILVDGQGVAIAGGLPGEQLQLPLAPPVPYPASPP